jgi:hypothetical protein
LFAPAAFVLFSLKYVETLDWAMAGLQNLPVVVFSLWALYLLFGTRSAQGDFGAGRFGLACAVGLLAALSSANGFLVAPIGFVAFAMRRHYARVALWTSTFLLGIAVYLYKDRPAYPTMHVAAYVKPLFVLAVLGLAAPGLLAIPTGIALIGVWLGLVRSGFHLVNRFGFAVSLWIFLTAILIAIGRGNYGLGGAQASQ